MNLQTGRYPVTSTTFVNTDRAAVYENARTNHDKTCLYFDGTGEYITNYVEAGQDGRGWFVTFCWSDRPNILGYYVTWRHVSAPMDSRAKFNARADRYFASKKLDVCERRAMRRAANYVSNRASINGAE